MAECMSLHVKKDTAKPVTELQRWSPPEGWVKAKLDAGIAKHGDKGGGGMILWGHAGDTRAAAGYLFGPITNHEMVEIIACRAAVKLASKIHVQKLHLETDNKRGAC